MHISSVSFFGTRPTGEHIKSGKGGSLNGPSILPSCISLFNLSLISCGSSFAVGRLSGALNLNCPVYSNAKPCFKPCMTYATLSLSGYLLSSSLSWLGLSGIGGTYISSASWRICLRGCCCSATLLLLFMLWAELCCMGW